MSFFQYFWNFWIKFWSRLWQPLWLSQISEKNWNFYDPRPPPHNFWPCSFNDIYALHTLLGHWFMGETYLPGVNPTKLFSSLNEDFSHFLLLILTISMYWQYFPMLQTLKLNNENLKNEEIKVWQDWLLSNNLTPYLRRFSRFTSCIFLTFRDRYVLTNRCRFSNRIKNRELKYEISWTSSTPLNLNILLWQGSQTRIDRRAKFQRKNCFTGRSLKGKKVHVVHKLQEKLWK